MRALLCLFLIVTVPAPASAQKKGQSEGNRLVEAAYKVKDREERLTLFAKALATGTLSKADAASVHNNRAAILSDLGRKKEAVAEVTKAIDLAPKAGFYYGNRARIRMSLKRYREAVSDFTKVIELSPKPSAYDYFDRCRAHAAADAKTAAIADCEQALKLNGKYRRARVFLEKLRK